MEGGTLSSSPDGTPESGTFSMWYTVECGIGQGRVQYTFYLIFQSSETSSYLYCYMTHYPYQYQIKQLYYVYHIW